MLTPARVSALASSRLALLALVIVTAAWKSLAGLSRVMSLAAPALSVVVPVTARFPRPVAVIVPVADAPLACVSTLSVPPTRLTREVKSTAPEVSRSRLPAVSTELRVRELASSRVALLAVVILTAAWKSLAGLSSVMSLIVPTLRIEIPVMLTGAVCVMAPAAERIKLLVVVTPTVLTVPIASASLL